MMAMKKNNIFRIQESNESIYSSGRIRDSKDNSLVQISSKGKHYSSTKNIETQNKLVDSSSLSNSQRTSSFLELPLSNNGFKKILDFLSNAWNIVFSSPKAKENED
jgi:hypothetical protein